MRIPLPTALKEPDAKAHAFPLQIALQAQQFMQASIFHSTVMDIAAGQRLREPNGFAAVEEELIEGGLDLAANNQAWAIIEEYQGLFDRFVFNNVLILLRSHWDWYINRLGAFTRQAMNLAAPRCQGLPKRVWRV